MQFLEDAVQTVAFIVTEESLNLASLDLRERGIDYPLYPLCSGYKGPDQQHTECTADLHLCFCYYKNLFSLDVAHLMFVVPRGSVHQLFKLTF